MVGNIGSINWDHLLGKGRIELYEAIEHYGDGSGVGHVYILAGDMDEAQAVMNSWLKRNMLPGEPPKAQKTELILLSTLDNNKYKGTTADILTGPSLRLEEKVRDNITL